MRVLQVHFRHFRAFEDVVLHPRGHVLLVGEAGAGRSTVVTGLAKVLSPDSTRTRTATELDFFGKDTSVRAEIEVVLGGLDNHFEQLFLDHLEVWDKDAGVLVEQLAEPEQLDRDEYELVVRLCYRAQWIEAEEHADHWVDYPKTSQPDLGLVDRVGRAERDAIPFALVHAGPRGVDLSDRGGFRRVVEQSPGSDLAAALALFEEKVEIAADGFSGSEQIRHALSSVLSPLRPLLAVDESLSPHDLVKFMPEGGSVAGLLRSLRAAINTGEPLGPIPLWRAGSSVETAFALGVAGALAGGGILVADDFGEQIDLGAAIHLAAHLRRAGEQVWLSTRRGTLGETFASDEIVRLSRQSPRVFHSKRSTTKLERQLERHRTTQLLPSLGGRVAVVFEGPHDRAAYGAVAQRRYDEGGQPLPYAYGVTFLDAAGADSSGGVSAVIRLAAAARAMGLLAIAVLDHDGDGPQQDAQLSAAADACDVVIQLPTGFAIEKALLQGVPEATVITVFNEMAAAFSIALPSNFAALSGSPLQTAARLAMKKHNLHAQFVNSLPPGLTLSVPEEVLGHVIAAAQGELQGVVSL